MALSGMTVGVLEVQLNKYAFGNKGKCKRHRQEPIVGPKFSELPSMVILNSQDPKKSTQNKKVHLNKFF